MRYCTRFDPHTRCFFNAHTQIASGELGSPANEQLLHTLRPAFWFSAHLHTKFPALVNHEEKDGGQNPSGAPTGGSSAAGSHQGNGGAGNGSASASASGRVEGSAADRSGGEVNTSGRGEERKTGQGSRGHPATRFLALDKCLPGRDFLQVGFFPFVF